MVVIALFRRVPATMALPLFADLEKLHLKKGSRFFFFPLLEQTVAIIFDSVARRQLLFGFSLVQLPCGASLSFLLPRHAGQVFSPGEF